MTGAEFPVLWPHAPFGPYFDPDTIRLAARLMVVPL